MRRFLCIAALISRFCGQSYIWHMSPPGRPVAIVWQVPASPTNSIYPAWWLAR